MLQAELNDGWCHRLSLELILYKTNLCVTKIKYILHNVQDYSVFLIRLFDRLRTNAGISLTHRKHVHDCIISLRGEVWTR